MQLAHAPLIFAAVACAACGGGPAAPPAVPVVTVPQAEPGASPPPAPPSTAAARAPAPKVPAAGLAFESPLETCGARQSYALVASYRCEDGSTPLGGDPMAGSRARRGSSRSHRPPRDPMDFANSHIVDIYEVPCPSGPRTLYVCMYHCQEGQSPMGR